MLESVQESSQRSDTGEGETPFDKGEDQTPLRTMRGMSRKERAASMRAVAIIALVSALCACASNYSASDLLASIDKTIRFVCGVHGAIPHMDASTNTGD